MEKREKGRRKEEAAGALGYLLLIPPLNNAFIMGKGEQRKGLIHRRVRES